MRRRRRCRKNPGASTLIIGGVVLAAVVVGVVLVSKSASAAGATLVGKDGTVFQATALPGTTSSAAQGGFAPGDLRVGDKITVDITAAGLTIPGVPAGANVLARMTQIDVPSNAFVMAVAIDPRMPDGQVMQVPKTAISGVAPA